ncbi:hypothetical protein RI129_009742 [Pyrocoelia pectoralis]|uniref:Transcription factor Adf-1 n=1 Tax=Pyrocoelia pectoralis TaxID=417401 RepID=A0AAN7ZCI5_9COLE
MNDEKLIELVREYHVLYDLSHCKYMDTGFKNNIWARIAKEMKQDVSTCKNRWSNIRDTYRKTLKKNVTKSGQSAKKLKLYKYSNQLEFLNKYFGEMRATKRNIHSLEEDEEEGEVKPDNIREDFVEESTLLSEPECLINDNISSLSHNNIPDNKITPLKKATNKNLEPPRSASGKLTDYLLKKKNERNTPVHPVDTFLAAIGSTLKSLDPYSLHLAKAEIFNTAQKYEMQMLMNQPPQGPTST